MAHTHSVYDTDAHFRIDKVTRAISNISTSKITLIEFDHNSERFTFEMPRYIEGHDMMQCSDVQVHYLNISTKGVQQPGVYPVDDMEISTDDEETVVFTWLVSQNATQYVGSLNFLIRFVCRTGETVDYVWNTAIYSDITISSGMYNGDDIAAEYPDILAQWEAKIEALEEKVDSGGGSGSGGGSDTLTWDGIAAGLKFADLSGNGTVCYFKVSDAVPTKEDFANGFSFAAAGSWANDIDAGDVPGEEAQAMFNEDGAGELIDGMILIAPYDGYSDYSLEKGVYFLRQFVAPTSGAFMYITELKIPGYAGFTDRVSNEPIILYSGNDLYLCEDSGLTRRVASKHLRNCVQSGRKILLYGEDVGDATEFYIVPHTFTFGNGVGLAVATIASIDVTLYSAEYVPPTTTETTSE